MKLRLTSFALLFALMSAFMLIPASSVAAKPGKGNGNPLKGVKAHAKLGDATVTVTQFDVNSSGKLVASGTVTSPTKGQLTTFSGAEVTVVPQQDGTCTILTLNLAPLDLNLLGLRIQTSEINLVITAEPGDGALLGNLLCSIANLLNGDENLIAGLLNQVLALLGNGIPSGSVLTGILPINFTGFFQQNGQLMANVVVRGENGAFVGPFAVPVQVASVAQQEGTCTILNLVIGPLDLNILGLRVQLFGATEADPVTVTITGVTGQGNLLGNLLCAITGLLDTQPDLPLTQRLNAIARILNRVLALLG
jgi:hypothetical protein